MPFGVHRHMLRFVGDRVGVERGERAEIAACRPGGVACERLVALRRAGEQRRALRERGEGVFVELGERGAAALGRARFDRAEIFRVAREAPRRPRRLQRRRHPAAVADARGVTAPVDLVGVGPQPVVALFAMRHPAIDRAGDETARRGVPVVQPEQDRRVHHRPAIRLLPFPRAFAVHRAPAIPVAGEVEMPGGVPEDHALQRLGGRHQPLDRDRLAPIEIEPLGVGIEPFLISVELVGGDVAEAVHAHAVLVRRVGERAQRGVDLVGLDAHQREARPLLRQIGIVGNAAAEIAVRDLAMVDPPVDELPCELEILELAERPQRDPCGGGGLHEGGHILGPIIDVGPILPREDIVGIDAQQIADVAEHARVERLALRGGVLLDEEAPIVLHLVEPVGDMFGKRGGAVLEHQADLGAVERCRVEARVARRDAEIEAVVRQDAVAQVEPQRARLAGADRDRQVDHVARGPDWVLHADVERDRPGAFQRG